MPRRNRYYKNKIRAQNFGKRKPFTFLLLAIFLVVCGYFLLRNKYWHKDTRLSLAIAGETGSIALASFDPHANKVTVVTIPENLEINLSHQLGTWKVGSIWKLGEQEKLGGRLVSESITRSLLLPTEGYADKGALGFTGSNPAEIMRSTFSFYKTNLSLGDRIGIALFSLSLRNSDRVEINLTETGYVSKSRLDDGSSGYKVKGSLPIKLASVFADSSISKEGKIVSIVDKGDSREVANKLGEIVEVLGAKVVAIRPEEVEELDCIVIGEDSSTSRKIAEVFSCAKDTSQKGGEVEIVFGEKFVKRF